MKRRAVLRYLSAVAAVMVGPKSEFAGVAEAQTAEPEGAGIFFNQLGFLPNRSKIATIHNASLNEATFRVRLAATDAVVFEGPLAAAALDAASGDEVRQAEFTAVKAPGTYRLEVGGQKSASFAIGADVYAEALRLTMRSYFGQRCGCAVDLGNGYQHAKCHMEEAYHRSTGKKEKMSKRSHGSHGWNKSHESHEGAGWHDAGDYGRYVVNSGITTGTLLWGWELYPDALRGLTLKIPESGRGTPDYLAEIRWNLEWMLSLQEDDGGVFHKQTSEQFCAFIMPEKDHMTSYVIGTGAEPYKSTCATAHLAAVMAIAARCYSGFDKAFANRCLAAARLGWEWAVLHPEVSFKNPEGVGTGEYGDSRCGDELLWASAELWRTTGEAKYEEAFVSGMNHDVLAELKIKAPSWSDVRSMACWTYFLAEREGVAEVKEKIKDATLRTAGELVARSVANGYGNTMQLQDYVWGSNSVAANQSMLLWIAQRMKPDGAMVEASLNNLHYVLGRNCMGISWVTQLGTQPFLHPHHRPSAADGIAQPWPGLLSGGPNAHPGDTVAMKLPRRPPMRMWVDDERAYSLNEVAINWNAPLVFLLAAANALSG